MNPWLESIAVTLLAIAGVVLGRWFGRLPKPYWLFGYFIPLVLIVLYALAMRFPAFSIIPPVSWMMMGRNKFAVIGFVTTLVLTTPLSRLKPARVRVLVSILMGLMVVSSSIWPFLAPAFNRSYLASLTTKLDNDGICRQSNEYNCGPAAAVTALRKLGFPAEEGEIAIQAHTSSATGTPPDILARTLQEKYGSQGLSSEYRVFHDLAELKAAGLSLAVIKYSFWVDHYVTVLEVKDEEIVAGDPFHGLRRFSRDEFERKWRFVGIVLKRKMN